MSSYNLSRVPTGHLSKAFAVNVQQDVYNPVLLTQSSPAAPGANSIAPDGVVNISHGNDSVPTRILLFPYAESEPGQSFYLRLYGWRSISVYSLKSVWIYYVLAEFLCVTGAIPGPITSPRGDPGPQAFRLPINPNENMCQSLAKVCGVLGQTGFINSMPPGYNYPAFAGVELQGSQVITFDFVTGSALTGICAANCLWAMA